MANNYLEFSEVIPRLTEEEETWLKHQLEYIYVYGDNEYQENAVPEDLASKDPDWVGCRAYRDMENFDPYFGEGAGFEYEFSGDDEDRGRYLWLYAAYGCVDRVAHLVQKFLRQFRPDDCWSLTWAETCSKPRVGEFGGGAVFVTASEIKWGSCWQFLENCKTKKRFVLYDGDGDSLVGENIYDSYADAAAAASGLDDVLIVEFPDLRPPRDPDVIATGEGDEAEEEDT